MEVPRAANPIQVNLLDAYMSSVSAIQVHLDDVENPIDRLDPFPKTL